MRSHIISENWVNRLPEFRQWLAFLRNALFRHVVCSINEFLFYTTCVDCIFFLNKKCAFSDAVTRATGFHGDETHRRQRQPAAAIRRHTRNAHKNNNNNNNSLCANTYCCTGESPSMHTPVSFFNNNFI